MKIRFHSPQSPLEVLQSGIVFYCQAVQMTYENLRIDEATAIELQCHETPSDRPPNTLAAYDGDVWVVFPNLLSPERRCFSDINISL